MLEKTHQDELTRMIQTSNPETSKRIQLAVLRGNSYDDIVSRIASYDESETMIDMPPPPAAIQQSAQYEDAFAGWKPGMRSSWDPEGFSEIRIDTSVPLVEVAALAFNAGWRGESLVEAVAVQIAEERGQNKFAIGDLNITNDTYGPSFGLWQIRSLRKPWEAGQPEEDRLRTFESTSEGADLLDPQTNADVAFQIWKAKGWKPWSVTHKSAETSENYYMNFIDQARQAVAELNRILGREE
jgi:hypothetical protein